MYLKPLRADLKRYLLRQNTEKKFAKQLALFLQNPRHPSLHTELLKPKEKKVYSFRIDRKYRAIFIYLGKGEIEIIDINPHYQ
ncbi:MAG: hypothetical protein A2Z24_02495 [Candidatus Woykebacteria bacterium RBG_16_44_10]|uniref:Toxin YoeB n=1 Tax=Candidatus Woykebacteria bacterium RBG_16_44_10 TaxID=1802597 RepID=A0A1G1WE84_9BACT|nr:MAG: hypothetical protein A2Z24_02495 [Candidatus Woykebacteria bacterium RBG_16_44_10]